MDAERQSPSQPSPYGADPERRQSWRLLWLSCINEFADADLQRKAWLKRESRNPHWSYVEIMCCYFNDSLFSEDYDWAMQNGLVSKAEAEVVAELHRQLSNHEPPGGNQYDPEAILNNDDWKAITSLARTAQQSLAKLLTSDKEQEALFEQIVPDFGISAHP